MTVTWDKKDIRGGRRIASEATGTGYIIVFSYDKNGEGVFAMASLDDGLCVIQFCYRNEMAAALNERKLLPVEVK